MRIRNRLSFIVLLLSFIFTNQLYSGELLGTSFNETVPGRHLFSALCYRGGPDGWGLAFYPDESLQLFRGTKKALDCDLAEFLIGYDYLEAPLLVSHVKGSTGSPIYETTLPFQRELNGKRYAFVHSGILSDFQQHLKLERFKPLGAGDSEHLFCYILGQIENEGIQTWNNTQFEWLQGVLQNANTLGTLSCLLSDGEYLFAYHDKKSGENFLHYIERKAPYGTVHLADTNLAIDLSTVYPASASGFVLCTKPLTTEEWTSTGHGQLIVLKDGKIIWEGITPVVNGNSSVKQNYPMYTLYRSYPNPFTTATTIHFFVLKESFITLEICSLKGELIRTLGKAVFTSGDHSMTFDGMDDNGKPLSNGVYLLRLKADNFIDTREIIVSK
jgi:glutamine amidotransferase